MALRRDGEVGLMAVLRADLFYPALIDRQGTEVVVTMMGLRASSSEGVQQACQAWAAAARAKAGEP